MDEILYQASLVLIQNGAIGVVCAALMYNTWQTGRFHAKERKEREEAMATERKEQNETLERARDQLIGVLDATNKIDASLTFKVEENSVQLSRFRDQLREVISKIDQITTNVNSCPCK